MPIVGCNISSGGGASLSWSPYALSAAKDYENPGSCIKVYSYSGSLSKWITAVLETKNMEGHE